MKYIIDVYTKGRFEGISRLRRLKSTIRLEDGRPYRNCPGCAQLWLESTVQTAQEIEDWIYNQKWNWFTYIGVVAVERLPSDE